MASGPPRFYAAGVVWTPWEVGGGDDLIVLDIMGTFRNRNSGPFFGAGKIGIFHPPIGRKKNTYIPLMYIAKWVIIWYLLYHLLGDL